MSKLASLTVFGQPQLEGQLSLVLSRSAPWPEEEVTVAHEVVTAFVEAGQRGAFPFPGTAAVDSALELDGPPVAAGDKLAFPLVARTIDARALQLLRHMLSRIEYGGDASLRSISVTHHGSVSPKRISYPIIDYDNEVDQYPDAPAQPGFSVHWDDELGHSRARRVLVEFPAVIEGGPIDVMIGYVDAWNRLLEWGAFALPMGLPDVLDNVAGLVSQFDAVTLEIEVPIYKSAEKGFDVLIHLLARYHHVEQPIRLVTIE